MEKKLSIRTVVICVLLALSLVMFASCKKKVKTDPNADNQQTNVTEETSATDTKAEEDNAVVSEEESKESNEAGIAQLRDDFENITIKFVYDSSAIIDSEITSLEEKAEWLRTNADATVTVQGHCDERGTTEYNIALGDRRAARVKGFLVDLGIDANRITTVSFGEENPAVSGNNEAAWEQNRRANCVID